MQVPSRRSLAECACLLLLAACEGGGSDIGPRIFPLGDDDYRVLVLDDQSRYVTSAAVAIDGATTGGVTGRLGRARVPGSPSGVRRLSVLGAAASATAADRLGTMTFAASLPDGGELPYAVHLPDVAPSSGLTLATGVLAALAVLDDRASSGAALALSAGTSVAAGAATSVLVRTGALSRGHLPGVLPLASPGARLFGAAAYVDPPELALSPGAALSMPNDLGLAPGVPAELFRLDPATGNWVQVGSGTVDPTAARIEAPVGSAVGGGPYAFATVVPATTVLSGRVVDASGTAVSGALVRAAAATTRTASDGGFVLPEIAAVDATGAPLTVVLEVHGGRDWRPTTVGSAVALLPGAQSVGDVALDTHRVMLVRMQLITRGALDPGRRFNISGALGGSFGAGVGYQDARVDYADQRAQTFVGLLTSRPLNSGTILIAEALADIGTPHHIDLQAFSREEDWWIPRDEGVTAVFVRDSIGTGPVQLAAVVSGSTPEQGLVDFTPESGVVTGEFGTAGQASAALATTAGGTTVTSAFTMVDVDSARIEIPLERARLSPDGGYDPYALVRGQLTGGGGGSLVRRLISTRRLALDDWYDAVLGGTGELGDVPFKVDPALTGATAFEVGVPTPQGNLAAAEGTALGTGYTLERLGLLSLPDVVPGTIVARDIPLDLAADTTFVGNDALTNLHAPMGLADLSFDLLARRSDGTLIDAARGVTGNMTQNGTSIEFRLPALQGQLAGGSYLVALGGSTVSAGKTVEQRTIIPLTAPGAASGPFVRFLDVPDIVAPSAGATVPSTGFTVQFTVPISTLYTIVELRSETAAEVRDWTAVLPASFSTFDFRELPPQVAQPLSPGATWTLTVSAARVETGPLSLVTDAYRRTIQNWIGLGFADQQVNAISSTSIQLTMN